MLSAFEPILRIAIIRAISVDRLHEFSVVLRQMGADVFVSAWSLRIGTVAGKRPFPERSSWKRPRTCWKWSGKTGTEIPRDFASTFKVPIRPSDGRASASFPESLKRELLEPNGSGNCDDHDHENECDKVCFDVLLFHETFFQMLFSRLPFTGFSIRLGITEK